MASRILPNPTRYDVSGEPGQEFSPIIDYFCYSKMIPKYVPADLGLPSTACQSRMVKHNKFDHVLDTIFCAFWTEFVHGALANISVLTNLSEWLILK